jgi:hypothetical protein
MEAQRAAAARPADHPAGLEHREPDVAFVGKGGRCRGNARNRDEGDQAGTDTGRRAHGGFLLFCFESEAIIARMAARRASLLGGFASLRSRHFIARGARDRLLIGRYADHHIVADRLHTSGFVFPETETR